MVEIDNLVTLSFFAGILILLTLCYNDYKQQIWKAKSNFLYGMGYVLFSVLNLIVYLGICAIMMDLSGFDELFSKDPVYRAKDALIPFVIAIMYFGTGATAYKVGGHKISFYKTIIDIFDDLFEISLVEKDKIQKSIEQSETEKDSLLKAIKDLHRESEGQGWDKIEKKWDTLKNEMELRENHERDLENIIAALEGEMTESDKQKVKGSIEEKIDETKKLTVSGLKSYLVEFIFKNIRSEAEIKSILEKIDISDFSIIERSSRSGIIARTVVIGFFTGILFGPVLTFGDSNSQLQLFYMWRGAIALALVGLIVSIGVHPEASFARALVSGIIAGFIGYPIFGIESAAQLKDLNFLIELASKAMYGIPFGIAFTVTLYLFRDIQIKSIALQLVFLGLMGAFSFSIARLFRHLTRIVATADYARLFSAKVAILGFLVCFFIAWGIGLFPKKSTK
jgi:hypothetical protein